MRWLLASEALIGIVNDVKRVRISGLIGAAPEIATLRSENPTAAFNFFWNTDFKPGIFKPIFRIALLAITALRVE